MTEETVAFERHTIYFSGIVQGVGFRYTTHRVASRFSVAGFVRNLPDGRVEAVVEGPPSEIRRFIEAIRVEMANYVSNIEESVGSAEGRFQAFEIRL